jgi:hypothetical protein
MSIDMSAVFLEVENTIACKINLLKALLFIPEVLLKTVLMISSTLGMPKIQFGAFLVQPHEAFRISRTLTGSPEDVWDLLLLAPKGDSSHSSRSQLEDELVSSVQEDDKSKEGKGILEADDRTLIGDELALECCWLIS